MPKVDRILAWHMGNGSTIPAKRELLTLTEFGTLALERQWEGDTVEEIIESANKDSMYFEYSGHFKLVRVEKRNLPSTHSKALM